MRRPFADRVLLFAAMALALVAIMRTHERTAVAWPPQTSGTDWWHLAANADVNPNWTASAWYIDPSNSTGVASDGNTCTSASAPCLTWHEVNEHRWGCMANPSACPRFRQATTIHWLSGQTTNTDLVYFSPVLENGATVVMQGDSTTVIATTTLSAVTAKATGTNTPLSVNVTSGNSLTLGTNIINSTRNNSKAWPSLQGSPGVGPWTMSQPLLPITVPLVSVNIGPAERNNWTIGDAVTVNYPFVVHVGYIRATVTDNPGGVGTFAPPLVVYNLAFGGPGYFNNNTPVHISGDVDIVECGATQFIVWEGATASTVTGIFNSGTDNVWGSNTATSAPSNYQWRLIGSTVGPTVLTGGSNSLIDGDAVMGSTTLLGSWLLGNVFAQGTLTVDNADVQTNSGSYGAPHIYGTTLNIIARSRVTHGVGGTFANTFPIASLQLNSQSTGCACSNTAIMASCNTALTGAALDGGTFSGNACTPLGSSIGSAGP